ncbi:MAG: AraC family transcriptional regulator [Gemmatimonadaceae bacterium]|nr:AraC family transcriptional regulator [Gemmatimonadaceae bacterium]
MLVATSSRQSSRYFIALSICLCGFLAGNSADPALRLEGALAYPAVLLAGYTTVFLWWYCLAVFDVTFRPRGAILAVGVAWVLLASADRRLFGVALANAGLSRVLVVLGLGVVAHVSWRVLHDRAGDLLDSRRRLRRITVLALAGQLGLDLTSDLVMGLEWQPPVLPIIQNTMLLAFTVWLIWIETRAHGSRTVGPVSVSPRASTAARASHRPSLPEAPTETATDEAPDDPRMTRLRQLMEEEHLYRNPDLTFAEFVHAMGSSEKTVRRLIREQFGHEHFRTFLNTYRVAEARRLLADPSRQHDKLIAVAFASGFASLPTFNRVFKELEGKPPSVFRARASRGASTPAPIGLGSTAHPAPTVIAP